MSIIAISSRILRRRLCSFNIRNLNQERPVLRFKQKNNINRQIPLSDEYLNLKEPTGSLGYILLGIPIVSFILGTWQVKRREWKLGLIKDIETKVSATPRPLPEDLNELDQMEYYPVRVRGEFLYDREFAIGPKNLITNDKGMSNVNGSLLSTSNSVGYYLITPFKVENRDTTILVNRGWIPTKPQKLPKEKLGHVPGPIEITGIVRLHEERPALMPNNTPSAGVWVYRDLKAMSFMADTDPVFLELVADSGVPNGPIAGQTRISLRNEHMAYIITWYSLTLISAWMWHRLFIKKLPLL